MRGLSLAQPLLFQAPTMLDGARRMFGFGLWLGAWTATAGGCSGEIKGTAAAALAGDSSVGTLGVDGASSNPGSTQLPDTAPGCRVPQTHVAQPFSCSMAAGYPADATPMSCESTSDCPRRGGPSPRWRRIACTGSAAPARASTATIAPAGAFAVAREARADTQDRARATCAYPRTAAPTPTADRTAIARPLYPLRAGRFTASKAITATTAETRA